MIIRHILKVNYHKFCLVP